MRKALVGTGLATAMAAVAGSVASQQGVRGWYTKIRKPGYVPPNAVFPIAWTTLYVDIAATSAATIERFRAEGQDGKARAYIAALGANLALNAGWSWVFFKMNKLGPSVVAAAALAASSADLTRRAADADPKFGAALAPYPLWCGFATVMSADIWRLNR
ncbi:TspO/MBR family protein [Mycolicibacterium sp.]|uniref:TspO/MBR family protein n=1 Tax=Mycolicibacterium sp. TaxID=2320850 RepID=UPI001D7F3427|nr:TspO/MBR family protein [Mycolicibacterium sp.]MCB1292156.1 tryptophan-rich sensory protein [Mycobacterium sp.]MCB9410319.1 tryptophan-rich sensory protein [Mycolicibacterium sp.]